MNLIIGGDSQAAVRSPVTDAQTWGAIVAGWHGWTHTNYAVGGSTSSHILGRISSELAAPGEHYVLQIGANDAFISPTGSYSFNPYWSGPQPSAVPLSQTLSNITAIYAATQAAGKSFTLVTPWAFFSTPSLVQFPFYVNAMFDLGAQLNFPVVDAFHVQLDLWWGSAPNIPSAPNMWDIYETDYQHPSAAGHQLIANLFRKPRNAASPLYMAA